LWRHAKHLLLAANAMITAPRPRVVIIIAAPLLRWPDVDRQGGCFSSILICNSAVFALGCVDLTARRLLPLAPQVSQVGNAELVDWEAVTLPLDQATIARTETHNSALAAIDARNARKLGTRARPIGQSTVRRLMATANFETTSSIPWELSLVKFSAAN